MNNEPSLYQRFLDEKEEILKHKWIESEKRGYDIGFEWALLDWVKNHRDLWKKWYEYNFKKVEEVSKCL